MNHFSTMSPSTVAKLEDDMAGVPRTREPHVDDFPYMSMSLRKAVVLSEAQNHRCAYCGVRMTDQKAGSNKLGTDATVEHVEARSRGGKVMWSNEVMACSLCNQGRGTFPALMYFTKVLEVGRWNAYRWALARQSQIDQQNHRRRR